MFGIFKKVVFGRPRNRQLFGYWDGEKKVWQDPLTIIDLLETDPVYRKDFHPLVAQQDQGQQGRDAWNVMLSAYRRAFNLKEYDPATQKGLTSSEVSALYHAFCLFTESLKKSIEPMQTQLQSMGATSTGSDAPTQNGTLVTCSTEKDKSGGESTKCDEEPITQ
jgi:hypothetical protein